MKYKSNLLAINVLRQESCHEQLELPSFIFPKLLNIFRIPIPKKTLLLINSSKLRHVDRSVKVTLELPPAPGQTYNPLFGVYLWEIIFTP